MAAEAPASPGGGSHESGDQSPRSNSNGDTKGSAKAGDTSAKKDVRPGPNAQISHQGSFSQGVSYGNSNTQAPHMMVPMQSNDFLAGVLTRKDHHVLMLALQITETILQKLPDVFVNSFIKEGVFFAIDGLLVPEKCSQLIFPVCNGIHLPLNSNQKSSSKVVMRCLCYAFDTGQSLSASETGTCKLEKDSIENLAKHIRISYFALESCDSEKGLTDILQKLRALSAELSDLMNMSVKIGSCTQDGEKCYSILCQIMEKLDGREPVSTFEFIESGIVKILVNCLFNGKYLREKVEPQSTFEVFARLLSSSDLSEESPLSALIQKLQGALSSLENFPVILSHASKYRSSFAIIPNGCCTSYPCLRVFRIKGTEQIESAAQALEPAENVQFKSPSTANPSEGESSGLMEPDSMAFDLLDNEANLSQPPPELDVNLIQRNRDETLSNDTHIVSVEDIVPYTKTSILPRTAVGPNFDSLPGNTPAKNQAVAYMLHPAFFSSMFNCELTSDLDKSSPTNDILFLLKSLEGGMPAWCNELMNSCSFLPSAGSLSRKKFIVLRDQVLEPAAQMMDRYAHVKVPIEVVYNEEVGTGLGPTLEFYTLGQIVAKALQDGRVLDLPFAKVFYKLFLQQELNLNDIQSFDPELDGCFWNTRIEDLCLDFTLPGYADYILSFDEDHKIVNMGNLEVYVSHIVDATIHTGISRQVEAFKSGLTRSAPNVCLNSNNSSRIVFPIKHLMIFTEEELERLLCGERDFWVFVTGAPRLPTRGSASLNPKLTIVRKHCSNCEDVDLPSVMTCANYLKLPPYSSKDKMKEKLLYAITEGQGSFHLS
ncbi:hypothetical protein D5086_029341 [Populus alba]|uniref:Uncharacterized protein n=1 Tax=Populus alba TaxID=43335 RepID=A0ACC4AU47_POPAL